MLTDQDLMALIEQIKNNTTRDAYEISIVSSAPSLASSKIGGLPYWPFELDIPTDTAGNPLFLLAQINLSDLGGDPRLPDHGLLQFFIANDDCYGLDFDYPIDKQEGFRVIWHEDIDESVHEADVEALGLRAATSEDDLPISAENAIVLTPTQSWITPADAGFEAAFIQAYQDLFGEDVSGKSWEDVVGYDVDLYHMLLKDNAVASVMLGYPFFTQWDPRSGNTLEFCDTVLLQLDSEMVADSVIMWGDCGIGAFFSNSDAVARGDFSHVLYNWDCY